MYWSACVDSLAIQSLYVIQYIIFILYLDRNIQAICVEQFVLHFYNTLLDRHFNMFKAYWKAYKRWCKGKSA